MQSEVLEKAGRVAKDDATGGEGKGREAGGGGTVVASGRPLRVALKQARWHLGLVLFALVSFPVLLMPRRIAVGLGGVTGILAYHLLAKVRRTAIGNIRSSFPHLETLAGWSPAHGTPEEISRRTFANFGRTIVEALKLYGGLGKGLIDGVEFRGLEHYERAFALGKGILFITGHCGNWELMALSFGVRHREVSVVARRQKYDPLTNFLERLRHRFGNSVIYADGAARSIFMKLRKNGIIGILMDQAVQPSEGEIVPFFGRGAWTTTMPALVAEKTGAALLPIFIHREGTGHVVTIHPPVEPVPGDAIATTGRLNRAIEEQIARHPDEWLWVYRRWKRT